ncbi:putative ferric-chelate reductase (NADH) [Lupinus albus]|uniref:Putative ferric-chelate reductase (NADH) n=1 Tax=Lupinus albus TaxID=3870 RepID=A0A6A4P712_LUPAL|nr:putative ferric-chelate reductase (NADH) [Lupinus albus]
MFIVFFIFHIGITYACLMLPSFYLFLVYRYLRFLQSRNQVRLVSSRVLPCEVVELNFSKAHGTWTQKLYKLLSTHSTIDRLGISGESGITPFISIVRELLSVKTTFKCKTPKVVLICSFNTYSSLSMINLILPVSSTPFDISNLELLIEAYITKDKEPQSNSHIELQTKWFKPNPSDV